MKKFLLLLFMISACDKDTKKQIEQIVAENPGIETVQVIPSPNPAPAPITAPPPTIPAGITMEQQFLTLMNNHRRDLGLNSLVHHAALATIALEHSTNMASGSVAFGHTGFSTRCSDGRAALGGANLCAENVASGQSTAQKVFDAWMNSPGHRANIEQARATHTGLGYKKSSAGTYYWTQIFLEKN